MNEQELAVVYAAADAQEAHLLKGLLAERDIEAVVLNEPLQGAAGGVPVGHPVSPRLAVVKKDEPKARQVVTAFQRQREIGPPQVDDIFPHDETEEDDWPVCPSCGKRRQTICLTCGVAGTDFPHADYQVSDWLPEQQAPPESCGCGSGGSCATGAVTDEDSQAAEGKPPALLKCETCDDIFEPRYYRNCPWCGHDFGEGISASPPSAEEPLNARTKLVLAVAGLGFLALLVYLLSMMNG
jgi:hypothetical protein